MNRARILFVDDEAAVLEGLRDLLRKERHRWDMAFAAGGEPALEELHQGHFDIVVSDMRMPGMDGAELLGRVKRDYPGVVRLVLSGHAERDAVTRAIGVSHQYLSKPCDASILRSVIERTFGLQRILENEAIRAVVGGLDQLPSTPRMYLELTQAASDPTAGIAQIAEIVQRDPAMSVKVLQLVNSAYFGAAHGVSSIRQAVVCLGVELLKGLALTAHVFGLMPRAVEGFSLENLQESSVRAAGIAKRLLADPKQAEDAYTAALVRDVGTSVIAQGLPAMFADVVHEAAASGRPPYVIEKEIIGVSHAEVGAYLLGIWGLPFSIVESVAFHHEPGLASEGPCDVLAAVYAAGVLADTACQGPAAPEPEALLDAAFLERAGHSADLPRWRAIADNEGCPAVQGGG